MSQFCLSDAASSLTSHSRKVKDYRGEEPLNGENTLRIQQKYSSLALPNSFPQHAVPRSTRLELIDWNPPYLSGLERGHGKSIMFVESWLLVGGSELGSVEMLRVFAEAGYRVTMVFTRFQYPDGVALRARVGQYTNDLHFLPAFLRMHDFPRYFKHLIDSRGIETVFLTNSQLMYEILPALAEQTPHVKYIDYLHNEVRRLLKYWTGLI